MKKTAHTETTGQFPDQVAAASQDAQHFLARQQNPPIGVPELANGAAQSRSSPEILLWSIEDIAKTTGLSVATLYRYKSSGKLPAWISLSPGTVRWRASDIRLWVEWGCPRRDEFEARKAVE